MLVHAHRLDDAELSPPVEAPAEHDVSGCYEPIVFFFVVVIVGLVVGVRLARIAQEVTPGIVWRYLLVVGSVLLFAALLHVVMWPLTPKQGSMIVPLFVATLYAIRGAQSRPRYLIIGTTLATLCFCCFLFATEHYWWWLAVA